MQKIFKTIFLVSLVAIIASCKTLTDDKFIYIGHGENTPNHQLYYDETRQLFILVNKKDGCFRKNGTGICLAFSHKEAEEFRKEVLGKMINIDYKLFKDDTGSDDLEELKMMNRLMVNKPIPIKDIYVHPVKQITLDRKLQYYISNNTYKLSANLVTTLIKDADGDKHVNVAYTISSPELEKKALKPFVVDPEYLYTHMTMEKVKLMKKTQQKVFKYKDKNLEMIDDYLDNVVDKKDIENCTPTKVEKEIKAMQQA